MTTSGQHRLVPDLHQTFWIPMLIRPAPKASSPSNVTMHHFAPISTHGAPCVVPANDANALADADLGDAEANDASDLSAEPEARRAMEDAMEDSTKFAAELEAGPAAELEAEPAAEPARRGASPLREYVINGAAVLTALALAATAIAILTMPSLAGRPVSAIRSEHVLSARPSAGASDLATAPPRAGVGPVMAPPAEQITTRAAAPALVAGAPAPAESTVVAPTACVETVAETAPPTLPLTAAGTPLDADPGPGDRADEDGSILPVGGDADRPGGAIAVDAVPASEAAPEVSTSAPRQRSRPPRRRAQHRGMGAGDDALVGTQVMPTSRDLLDMPADVLASGS